MDVTPLAERSTRETQAVSLTMVRQTETGLTGVGGRREVQEEGGEEHTHSWDGPTDRQRGGQRALFFTTASAEPENDG